MIWNKYSFLAVSLLTAFPKEILLSQFSVLYDFEKKYDIFIYLILSFISRLLALYTYYRMFW